MSIYDKASLVQIPSGYKSGTLYNVLPNDADGDFDYSGGTNGTRVNKDGLIEEISADTPRLNYPLLNGVVQDNPTVLLEPQRTNLVTYSEDFSEWIQTRATIISNDTTSPDGSVNASKLSANTDDNTHELAFSFSFTDNDFAFSVFAKKEELDKLTLFYTGVNKAATFDLTNGTTTSASFGNLPSKVEMVDYGNGWYRCSITDNTNGASQCRIRLGSGSGFAGNDTDGVYIYGAQLEQGSYPTSYIPTNGEVSGVTRSADEANGAEADFNDSEGVLYVNARIFDNSETTDKCINISSGDNSNYITIQWTNPSKIVFNLYNGSNQVLTDTTAYNTEEYLKIAFRYKENDVAIYVNGNLVATDTDASMFAVGSLTTLDFTVGNLGSDFYFYGGLKELIYFDVSLNNTELETLTSYRSFNEMATEQLYTIQ